MGMCRGTNQSGPVCSGLLKHSQSIGFKLERPVQWSEVDSLEDAAQHCEQAGRTPGKWTVIFPNCDHYMLTAAWDLQKCDFIIFKFQLRKNGFSNHLDIVHMISSDGP